MFLALHWKQTLVSRRDRGHTQIPSNPIKDKRTIIKSIMATRGSTDHFEVKKKRLTKLTFFFSFKKKSCIFASFNLKCFYSETFIWSSFCLLYRFGSAFLFARVGWLVAHQVWVVVASACPAFIYHFVSVLAIPCVSAWQVEDREMNPLRCQRCQAHLLMDIILAL